MDKEKAINCIQDLIDVANSHGSACIYKRNETFSELENVLACLQNSEPVIRCKDCNFYTTIEGERGVKYNICELHDTAMKENDFCSYGEPVEKPVESVDNLGGVNNDRN